MAGAPRPGLPIWTKASAGKTLAMRNLTPRGINARTIVSMAANKESKRQPQIRSCTKQTLPTAMRDVWLDHISLCNVRTF